MEDPRERAPGPPLGAREGPREGAPPALPPAKGDLPWVAVFFVLALAARVFAALQTRVITPDGVEFVEIAKAFAAGDAAGALAHAHHPLYPFLVSIAWRITGEWTAAASAVSAACGALAAVPLYFLARRIAGRGPARFAGFVYAFLPPFVRFGADAVSESAFHLFLLSALALAAPAPGERAWAWWKGALAGLFAALAYYVRPEAVLAAAAAGSWWMGSLAARRGSRKPYVALAAFSAVFAAGIAPYLLHVREATGEFTITKKKPAAHLLNVYQGEQGDAEAAGARSDLPRTSSAVGVALETGERLVYDLFYLPAILAIAGLAWPRKREAWTVDLYLLLPAAFWIAVCFLLARSHGYVSHRHLSPAALLLLAFAGRGALAAGKWLAPALRSATAKWGEERVAAGGAAALAVLCAVLGSTSAFRAYRSGKTYLIEVGRELRASEGSGRMFVGNSIRIAYYADGRHADIPPFAGFEAVCRRILDLRADLLVIDLLDLYFPVRHAELLERFRDPERPPPGFSLVRRWSLGEGSGRTRDLCAYRVDREALRAALEESRRAADGTGSR